MWKGIVFLSFRTPSWQKLNPPGEKSWTHTLLWQTNNPTKPFFKQSAQSKYSNYKHISYENGNIDC